MADIPRDDSQEEKNDKREFIRETIVKQEKPRRRGRALLWTLALALVFGGTSSLAFVVSQPFWEGRFGETEPQEDISLARDDTSAAPADTDAAEESSEETTQSNLVTVDRDELESLVAEAVERSSSDLSDVTSIFTSLNSMIAEANKSLVVITVSTTDLDWFDNEISSDHQGCGMIAAITGQEVLILTDSQLVSGQATIHVSFGNHGGGIRILQADGQHHRHGGGLRAGEQLGQQHSQLCAGHYPGQFLPDHPGNPGGGHGQPTGDHTLHRLWNDFVCEQQCAGGGQPGAAALYGHHRCLFCLRLSAESER